MFEYFTVNQADFDGAVMITSAGGCIASWVVALLAPVRAFLGDYGSVPVEEGIRGTYEAFRTLLQRGLLQAELIA